MRSLPSLWLGLRGEQCVGAELDALQSSDVRVFHDLVITDTEKAWNIDHVVLTRSGLFTFETKCRRKKVKDEERHKLCFDGHKINFPDGSYDTRALNQAHRQADWLSKASPDWTGGLSIPVTAVLVFPGWFVEATGKGPVTVVMEKQIRLLLQGNKEIVDDRSWFLLNKKLEALTQIELPKDPADKKIQRKKIGRVNSHQANHPRFRHSGSDLGQSTPGRNS